MSDRELLELAAKEPNVRTAWNPLENDGDALRLAVKLELFECLALDYQQGKLDSDDPYAATRRAIVRAAAEIGKGMK